MSLLKKLSIGSIGVSVLAGCDSNSYKILTQPRTIESTISDPDLIKKDEQEATYHFKLIDIIEPKRGENLYDVLAIGSAILDPSILPDDKRNTPLGHPFKEGHPSLEIYFSPSFAKAYEINPNIRETLAQELNIMDREKIKIATEDQVRLFTEDFSLYGGQFLPYEHYKRIAESNPGLLLRELMRQKGFETQQTEFNNDLMKTFYPEENK